MACLVVATTGGTVGAASWTSTGSPGSSTVPTASGRYDPYSPGIASNVRTVYKSAAYARYDQWVCVTHRLWRLDTNTYLHTQTWVFVNQFSKCGWILASQASIVDGGAIFSPYYGTQIVPTYGYSLDVKITWQLSNGAVIGTQTIDYNATSDYQCTPAYKCYIGNSTIGAWIDFDF